MAKKTKRGWDKSGLDLGEYLPEPCEIDEELSLYIAEVVAPHYISSTLTQGGDAQSSIETDDDEIYTYMTTSEVNGKHFYLGVLPEFKQ